MSAHTFAIDDIDHCPFMPVFGAPALSIERGSGTEALVNALLTHYDLDLARFEPRFLNAGPAADALVLAPRGDGVIGAGAPVRYLRLV